MATCMLPMFAGMIPGGLRYGSSYVVEFEPDSPWFEMSLTMAAEALIDGLKTEYHVFIHPPSEVRESLSKLGLDVERLEREDSLRILDTYDVMTGLAAPETPAGMRSKGREPIETHHSFNLEGWSGRVLNAIKQGVTQDEKRWLHLDDNTSIINHYSEERTIIDTWRERLVPYARVRELVLVNSLVSGVASENFYKHFEALCDGIIDLQSREEAGRFEHYARVRTLRGGSVDSRWRRLRLLSNGGIKTDSGPVKERGLGLGGWLKGPRK